MNKNLFSVKAELCYLEIWLLIMGTLAFAFYLGDNSFSTSKAKEIRSFLAEWLAKSKIGIVSAETSSCCKLTNDNRVCQNIQSSECSGSCKQACLPTSCTNTVDCKQGCCFDGKEGTCSLNTPKTTCTSSGGTWREGGSCNIAECAAGCCVLPTNGESWFMTESRCKKLANFYSVSKDFRDISEEQCIAIQQSRTYGACIYADSCRFITQSECLERGGDFRVNTLCSNPNLNTSCLRQASRACVDGKDEVYWFDSCGNRENIWSSDKDSSWNNGVVLNKSKSCNSASANIDSESCGNCDYKKGSRCENAMCKDLGCRENGKNYKSGESWCAYDGYIGDGRDVVGSRYVRKMCVEGKITTEACEDYRQEVCAQKTEEGLRVSECRANRWRECITHNNNSVECLKNPDCEWRIMALFDNNPKSSIKICTPKYPPGFDLAGEAREAATKLCDTADITCKVVFVCGKCKQNCQCLTKQFTETMNDWCSSMGDCGAEANVIGEVSKAGHSLVTTARNKPPQLQPDYLKMLEGLATPKTGQMVNDFTNATKKEIIFSEFAYNMAVAGTGGSENTKWDYLEFYWWDYAIIVGQIAWMVRVFWTTVYKLVFGFGGKKCKTSIQTVTFNCNTWKAPTGGENCEKCDEESDFPCTKYRCESLGRACRLYNEGTEQERCYWDKNDTSNPVIDVRNLSAGYKFIEKTETRAKITTSDGKCVEGYSVLSLNIHTDKPTLCKYDGTDEKFDDMTGEISEFELKDHNFTLVLPTIETIYWELDGASEYEIEDDVSTLVNNTMKNVSFYIRCQDDNGREDNYLLKTCVSPVDSKSPEIIKTNPEADSYFAFGAASIPLEVYANEPATCKYDTSDKSYYNMRYSMICESNLSDITDDGWRCSSSLTRNQTKVYIRCADQPQETNGRNVNNNSYILELKESTSRLIITELAPNGTLSFGPEGGEVVLRAKTSGGANGRAICSWDINGVVDQFYYTNDVEHSYTFTALDAGNYNVDVKCEDAAGNTAKARTSFTVVIDKEPPRVLRVYNWEGLKVITDVESRCAYDTSSCNFEYVNGTEMSGMEKEHTTDWIAGQIYYIKCKDIWDNLPQGCSIVVKAGRELNYVEEARGDSWEEEFLES